MAEFVDIVMPESEEGTETYLEQWFKQPGDYVREHEPLLEVNTDKVTMEIAAPASGVLREILKESGDALQPGDVLGKIEVVREEKAGEKGKEKAEAEAEEKGEETATAAHAGPESSAPPAATALSPAVKRLLKEHNIDPSQITGTGRGGRITVEDVENYLRSQSEGSQPETVSGGIPSHRVPHSPIRKRIATHMVESMLKTAPHVTSVFEADLSAIIEHRNQHKKAFQEKGIHLTFTAYFTLAAVKALQAVPTVNSRWHDDALEVFEDYNIGIAVATDEGLVVPVIQKAQELDLEETARRLQDITTRAREGKLTAEDVKNGTFTITNHGMTGSLIATPIINQPQSAILGIGKMEKRVVVVEKNGKDTTEIKPMAYVTLTVDHRALDGYVANQFLTHFVNALEEWGRGN
ncbi:MAG: dihydrolipoamide succinyltransferase [Calditrichaeota bacterium]|nr:MAG: dihydrolipoamide succinyltransferase [Calditrichota bacterium]